MSKDGVYPSLHLRTGCRFVLQGRSKSLVHRRHSVLDQLFTLDDVVALVPAAFADLVRSVAGEVLFARTAEATARLCSCGRSAVAGAFDFRVTTPRETLYPSVGHER